MLAALGGAAAKETILMNRAASVKNLFITCFLQFVFIHIGRRRKQLVYEGNVKA
jgi:hypothetical protein